MDIETLQKKHDAIQEQVKKLNEMTKDIEGEGCTVKYTVSEPFNKIDFVVITKTIKF